MKFQFLSGDLVRFMGNLTIFEKNALDNFSRNLDEISRNRTQSQLENFKFKKLDKFSRIFHRFKIELGKSSRGSFGPNTGGQFRDNDYYEDAAHFMICEKCLVKEIELPL